MDARKPDPATQSGDRIETRPPEDIFSSLPPEAPVPDGQPRKRSLFARIRQVFRLIFVGDAEREQRPATGMAARLRENFSQASSAGDKPMTRKELFAALDAPLHGLMPDDINYASEVDAALSRRPAFTARALSVAVALLVVALLVWAAWAPIDEVTHAEGSVVGSRRTQSVSNLEGGILQAVLVREGEVVEKGQVVAQLENVMAESSYRDALYKLVEHRLAIMRLEAMLRDEEPVFPSDLPVFLKEILVNTVGGVVKPGEAIMDIVPMDESLLVEVRVRPQDVAFLRPGQDVMIKVSAYDFSIYGGLPGKLESISADTIEDKKGDFYYLVKVRTGETAIRRNDEILPIIPGMIVVADIIIGKKTVLDYILKPVMKARQNALTER